MADEYDSYDEMDDVLPSFSFGMDKFQQGFGNEIKETEIRNRMMQIEVMKFDFLSSFHVINSVEGCFIIELLVVVPSFWLSVFQRFLAYVSWIWFWNGFVRLMLFHSLQGNNKNKRKESSSTAQRSRSQSKSRSTRSKTAPKVEAAGGRRRDKIQKVKGTSLIYEVRTC